MSSFLNKKKTTISDIAFDPIREAYYIFNPGFGLWQLSDENEVLDYVQLNYEFPAATPKSLRIFLKNSSLNIVFWNNRFDEKTSNIFFPTKDYLIVYSTTKKLFSTLLYQDPEFTSHLEALQRCSIITFSNCRFSLNEINFFFSSLYNSENLSREDQLETLCPQLFSFLVKTFS
jgi:hypothetical protein